MSDERKFHPITELSRHRYAPWRMLHRSDGYWIVEQLDRMTMKKRTYGPFKAKGDAKHTWKTLTENDQLASLL